MAKAAVMYDARAILKRVTVLKQQRLRTGTAAHAALASEWAYKPALLRTSAVVGPHGSEGQGLLSECQL